MAKPQVTAVCSSLLVLLTNSASPASSRMPLLAPPLPLLFGAWEEGSVLNS